MMPAVNSRVLMVAVGILVFVLCGCGCVGNDYYWRLDNTSRGNKPEFYTASGKPKPIHYAIVTINDNNGFLEKRAWAVSSPHGDEPQKFVRLKYGVLPEGYWEMVPPKELSFGVRYRVHISYGDYISDFCFERKILGGRDAVVSVPCVYKAR